MTNKSHGSKLTDIERYARLVAATVKGQAERAVLLADEGLDEVSAARLKEAAESTLRGPDANAWTSRFSLAYQAALRGRRPPPPLLEPESTPAPGPPVETPFALPPNPRPPHALVIDEATASPEGQGEGTLPVDKPHRVAVTPYVPFTAVCDDALGFEAFAAYRADMTVWPEHAEAIFDRYGLSDIRRRRAVHAVWAERLKDPTLLAQWESRVEALIAVRRSGA